MQLMELVRSIKKDQSDTNERHFNNTKTLMHEIKGLKNEIKELKEQSERNSINKSRTSNPFDA